MQAWAPTAMAMAATKKLVNCILKVGKVYIQKV